MVVEVAGAELLSVLPKLDRHDRRIFANSSRIE
jgi:hypothetical protein